MKNAAERRGIEQGHKQGMEAGLAQGKEEGSREKALETAKNMLEMNLGSKEQIAKVTGLTLEAIEELTEK